MPSYHDLKVGETLDLAGSGQVRVTLVAKSGRRARLAIEADAAVAIRPPRERGEREDRGARGDRTEVAVKRDREDGQPQIVASDLAANANRAGMLLSTRSG